MKTKIKKIKNKNCFFYLKRHERYKKITNRKENEYKLIKRYRTKKKTT